MAIKMLLAKIGIDAHDRGIRVVACALRDQGIEVIYTGPWQTIGSISKAAVEEDVDVVGISTLGGDYVLIPKLLQHFKQEKIDIPIVVGGIIPTDIEEDLKKKGVMAFFHPGTSPESIVAAINAIIADRTRSHSRI
jgi:methylmalonyl-CoA mutase C-terminal domain/subunit